MKISLPQNKFIRWAAYILGTIIVGAIGSGVWEVMMKPLSFKSRDLVLNLLTFGFDSYKTSIYQQVAKGATQNVSISIYSTISNLILMAAGYAAIDAYFKAKKVKQEHIELTNKIETSIQELENNIEPTGPKTTPEQLKNKLIELKEVNSRLSTKKSMSCLGRIFL